MSILLASGRTRQPQQPAPINYANPLANGLRFFASPVGFRLYDHVQGRMPTGSGTQFTNGIQSTTQGSLATTFLSAGSDLQALPDLSTYNILGALTLLWGGIITSGSAFRAFCSKIAPAGNGATNTPFDFRTDSSATPKLALVRANAVTNAQVISTFGASVGVYHQCGVVTDLTNPARFFIDGVVEVNGSVMSIVPTAVASNLNIGRRQDGAVQMNGRVEFVAGWARALSDTEIQMMYRNPWRMFAGSQRMNYAPAAAVLGLRAIGAAAGSGGGIGAPAFGAGG